MKTELYWIPTNTPGRIAIAPRPRGGDWLEEEIRAWGKAGAKVVVSLLEPDEVVQLDLTREQTFCEAQGIAFLSLPIPDRESPSTSKAEWLLLQLANHLGAGESVVIHCRQGIGRAALIAIALLLMTGMDPDAAIERVSEARTCPVPETAEQKRWIRSFAKSAAGMLAR